MNNMNNIPKICISSQDRMELKRECFRGLMESFGHQSLARYENLLCSSQSSSSLSSSNGKHSVSFLKIFMGLSALASIPFSSASHSDGYSNSSANLLQGNRDFPQRKEHRPLTIQFAHGTEPQQWLEIRHPQLKCSAFRVSDEIAVSVSGCLYSTGSQFPGPLLISPLRLGGSSWKPADIVRNEEMEKGGCHVLPGQGGRHSCGIEFLKTHSDSDQVLSGYSKYLPTQEVCHHMSNLLEGLPMSTQFPHRENMPGFSIWRSIDRVGSNFGVRSHGKKVGGSFEVTELSVFRNKSIYACSGSSFCIDTSDSKDKLYLCDSDRAGYSGYAGESVFFDGHLVGLTQSKCRAMNYISVVDLCAQGHLVSDQDDETWLPGEPMGTTAFPLRTSAQATTTAAQATTTAAQATTTAAQATTTVAQATTTAAQATTTAAQATTTAAQPKTTVDPKSSSKKPVDYRALIGLTIGATISASAVATACLVSYLKRRRAEVRLAQQDNIQMGDL